MINFLNQIKNKQFFLWGSIILILLFFFDLFFVKKPLDFFLAVLIISWYWLNKANKIDIDFSFIVGLFFLSFCPFLILFSEAMAEKAGIWAFLLFFSGTLLGFGKKEIK